MDIRLPAAVATDDERRAVDRILGPPTTGWEGGERRRVDGHVATGGHAARARRHLLLPVLHALQDDIGWISDGAVGYVCERLVVPAAEVYGVATFYGLLSVAEAPPVAIHLCDDIVCRTAGAKELFTALADTVGPEGSSDGSRTWHRSNCLGQCDAAPAAFVQAAGEGRRTVIRADLDRLAAAPTDDREPAYAVIGDPVLTARFGTADPGDLDAYRSSGGYVALRRALEIGPDAVVAIVEASGLRGRGGAAFPTGRKWRAVADTEAAERLVVCNADESEPGTFKDRMLMERDPFAVVEGLTIAGHATGATKGFIYVRGEYPDAEDRLVAAIEEAEAAGLLGDDVLGSGFPFHIELRRGAGAYICGEETALFESIEGFRGEPRAKPPYPTTDGLFGRPTAVNNVETLAAAVAIVAEVPGAANTKLFCVSGHVEAPGVVEAPFGVTVRELLTVAGSARPPQAVLFGGAAGRFLAPAELDVPLGYEPPSPPLGSGAVVAFGPGVDMDDVVQRIAEFFRDESCGQCVPCREGTVRQDEALRRLVAGSDERGLIDEIARVMRDASICGLGQTAAEAVTSAIALGLVGGAR